MGMAVREGWRNDNPCASFPLHPETPRHRYLTTEEAERLFQLLDRWEDRLEASVLLVLLNTGARRGELAKAEWSEIDFVRARWNKPSGHTKARRFHAVPLNETALAAFRVLRTLTNSASVIDGTTKDPTGVIDRAWRKVRDAAALGDVRLHDLRHSFASFLADVGESLPTIGALLGHSSPATTNRYVHLTDAAMRSAVGKISRNRS
jgi:integrase